MKKTTIRKIAPYCPKCDAVPAETQKNGDSSLVVSRECEKHQPVFVKTELNGIMVSKKFLNLFREMHIVGFLPLRKSF